MLVCSKSLRRSIIFFNEASFECHGVTLDSEEDEVYSFSIWGEMRDLEKAALSTGYRLDRKHSAMLARDISYSQLIVKEISLVSCPRACRQYRMSFVYIDSSSGNYVLITWDIPVINNPTFTMSQIPL